ncbi:MAG: hypothetical protein HQK78_19790 [Desulfobacterales bacterium]|nr:hypothetical protein [Desulfobacterales bacterium]
MLKSEFTRVYDRFKESVFPKIKKIYEFPVLYAGWELDYKGWIGIDEENNKHIILTEDRHAYISDENELLDKIKEYQDAIDRTEKALQILKYEK